jgi:membrane-bound ClpP family serine protease
MTNQPPRETKDNESLGEKFSETFNNLKQNDKIDSLYKYAQDNTRDTVAYILLILGIILLFFKHLWGGALIGIIVGIYLYDEIMAIVQNLNGFIEEQGMVRSLVLAGVVLGFFISAPMIFIGGAVGLGIKHLVGNEKKPPR